MSRAPPGNVGITGADIDPNAGGHQYPPQPAPTHEPQGMSNFVDGSGPIFSMYLETAAEEDKKLAEGWKADADGILIFTGLFSAAVASLISVSIQDIRPNSQDTSNFYLANIYQIIADSNRSNISLPSSPPPFSPPTYAVWVNALWFLSLAISITCALLATLLQQWARRYVKVTQPRYSPHKRARIRAFFAEGVDKFLLPWAVEALPTLLHVSLSLFFAGLVVFLCNVNLSIFKLVLSWIGVYTAFYGCFTFIPIFYHDSPYYTPLTSLVWLTITGIPFVTSQALRRLTYLSCFSYEAYNRFQTLEKSYRKLLVQGMQKTAEETALNAPSEIDTRAFLWTLNSLDEDEELERFFSGLPGFRSSKVVDDPLPSLTQEQKEKLLSALIGLSDSTFSPNLLPELVKNRRAVICTKALDLAQIPHAYDWILDRIVYGDQHEGLRTAEFGRIVRGWANSPSGNQDTALVVRAILTCIVAKAERRNDSWFILASNALGVSEAVLRDYATNGDSLSLAILIHVTHQQFDLFLKQHWLRSKLSEVLQAASNFNVQDTSPELQHEFCALWNRNVLGARNDNDWTIAGYTLRPIRNVYISLHQDTDSAPTQFSASTGNWDHILWEPSSYPVCNVASHIHGDSTSTAYTPTILHDNAALSPASLASPDAHSLSVPTPLRVVESLTDVPLPDNFHPAHQTTIESLRIPVTSPDPAITGAIRDIVTSGITTPDPPLETSTSALPLSSTPPAVAVALHYNPDLLTPSDLPNLPSSASSNLVLDNILPTGSSLSSRLPITRSDLSPSFPNSHSSTIVPTASNASPGSTSAPDLGAADKDDGSPKPGLCKEQDVLDPPSVNRAIQATTMATLDLPQQAPSLPSVLDPDVTDLDVAIADPLLLEPNAEYTGDRPSHPLHCRYDIV